MLKSPAMNVKLPVSPLSSVVFCFTYFETQILSKCSISDLLTFYHQSPICVSGNVSLSHFE